MDSTSSTRLIIGPTSKLVNVFEKIIFPYVNRVREDLAAPSQKALLLMDNFTGQTTTSVMEMLEEQGIVVLWFWAVLLTVCSLWT